MAAPKKEILLELSGIEKSFGSQKILKGISLQVFEGEFLTLLGPSGCGKTTTLRIIGGFERPDSGTVAMQGRDISPLPPYKRDIHTVFQHYALFPHYNVYDNVAFSLRIQGLPKEEIEKRVTSALDLVRLSGYETRPIHQLSGGQQQRIALARALAGRPKLILLDEPLGALDLKLRKGMQLELKKIQRKLSMTFIYVTHDQEEAMTLSDRIAVFNQGEIEQLARPKEIYDAPSNAFVADFIGTANILSAKVTQVLEGQSIEVLVEEELPLTLPWPGFDLKAGQSVRLALRPESLQVSATQPPEGLSVLSVLKDVVYLGFQTQFFVRPFKKSRKRLMGVQTHWPLNGSKRNQEIWLRLDPAKIKVLVR